MYLPSSVNCSLGVLSLIAQHEGRPCRSGAIAAELQVTENAVGKALVILRHGGLIRKISGSKGGFVLTRSASTISVGDVVALFARGLDVGDPVSPLGRPDVDHWFADLWSLINEKLYRALNSITVSDLAVKELRMTPISPTRDLIGRTTPCESSQGLLPA